MASLGYMAINSLAMNLKLLGIGTWMTIMRPGQREKRVESLACKMIGVEQTSETGFDFMHRSTYNQFPYGSYQEQPIFFLTVL